MKLKRIVSLLAVAALTTSVLVGCGGKENTGDNAKLNDGTYKAESEKDDRGYAGFIEIEVKDGKITTVKYDEKNDAGSKLDDEAYNTQMMEVNKTNPKEAFPQLEASLVEKQDASKVDVVTGATGTTNTFKSLAEKALKDAQ